MRHGKKINHLGRKAPHRKAMMANLACSLIEHKRITTTVAKAKALRQFIEPILTKTKEDTTHSRRTAFSYLRNKYAVSELFGEVARKILNRPGGYTRIIKTDFRLGDAADMAMIELVDFNELYSAKSETKKSTRRGRSKAKVETTEDSTPSLPAADKDTTQETTKETPKDSAE